MRSTGHAKKRCASELSSYTQWQPNSRHDFSSGPRYLGNDGVADVVSPWHGENDATDGDFFGPAAHARGRPTP